MRGAVPLAFVGVGDGVVDAEALPGGDGDTNSDGVTDVADLLALLAAFGSASCSPGPSGCTPRPSPSPPGRPLLPLLSLSPTAVEKQTRGVISLADGQSSPQPPQL